MKTKLFLLMGLLALLIFESCKKYQDGPFLSLRTPTNRLSGSWKIDAGTWDLATESTNVIPQYYYNYNGTNTISIQFEGNGNAEMGEFTYNNPMVSSEDIKGNWEFTATKNELILIFDENSVMAGQVHNFDINELSNKNMELEDEYSDDKIWLVAE